MLLKLLSLLLFSFTLQTAIAVDVPITRFPLQNYSQDIDHWINPQAKDYDKPLVSLEYQQQRAQDYLQHWFSPWDENYVKQTIGQINPNIAEIEQFFLNKFDNKDKQGDRLNYLANYRLSSHKWTELLRQNININKLKNISYVASHRAIIVNNTFARLLPTHEPSYSDFTLAGQGYPFDNLQVSSVWAGTPVYVIAATEDQSWLLVLTPAFIDWVPAHDVAYLSAMQRHYFKSQAQKNLGVIVDTQAPVLYANNQFDFSAYVGASYPIVKMMADYADILVAHRNNSGGVRFSIDKVARDNLVTMPFVATPRHFAKLYRTLINRPYGWGGVYHYNDCSQELRSLYAAFGIWLGRNSSSQLEGGHMIDQSSLTTKQRLEYLIKHGHPFMTMVFIGGHVLQYIGSADNAAEPSGKMAMTYQNVWGLHPPNSITPNRRDIIGQSVLLPMLSYYPEAPDDQSEAAKTYFMLVNLDVLPQDVYTLKIKPLMQLMQP